VPSGQLAFADKLVICSDVPYPPQEFFDANANPIGSDIEIGQEIAKRLGVTPVIQNSVFDTIIAAVTAGKCDIIISAQNITSARIKQVDMIPYFQAGQSFVVAAGNPLGIKVQNDLCGKKIAAETGTTEVDYLQGTGGYKGQGLSAACTKAKLPVSSRCRPARLTRISQTHRSPATTPSSIRTSSPCPALPWASRSRESVSPRATRACAMQSSRRSSR
jgi:hypothetical protein